jgi:hypothetical protein
MLTSFRFRAILLIPFAPFFVLFCHVIESSSVEDLNLLQAFVTSLIPAIPQSEPVEKLHRLCQVLSNVAALYVEAKAQLPADQNMLPIGNEFDMYLSALGLMPMEGQMLSEAAGGDAPMSGQMSYLGDWFSGSRHMMDLLETDMPKFGTEDWM